MLVYMYGGKQCSPDQTAQEQSAQEQSDLCPHCRKATKTFQQATIADGQRYD